MKKVTALLFLAMVMALDWGVGAALATPVKYFEKMAVNNQTAEWWNFNTARMLRTPRWASDDIDDATGILFDPVSGDPVGNATLVLFFKDDGRDPLSALGEYASVKVNGQEVYSGAVNMGRNKFLIPTASWDGAPIDVTVSASDGSDFRWMRGDLRAKYTPDVAPVPEPATMLLFGTGLVGLAGAGIRARKK